ncbi:MAG: hypothetical protein D6819_05865 [Gammaproteobacteria bacterium]|nr:MAG: hypothetical protein D6819_05865 [Gammaproteobacteria bacterium]
MQRYAVLLPPLLMAATRFHHFDIPDASLAAFFLAGLFVPSALMLPLLLIEAFLIDYLAIAWLGVSSFCVTPAYAFLIPTYALMWAAGRRSIPYLASGRLPAVAGLALGASLMAFFISNASFYAFSGYFAETPLWDYAISVAPYALPYIGTSLAYITFFAWASRLSQRVWA